MESGEASPIVIFEKVALGRFSFLIAILQYAVFYTCSYSTEYQCLKLCTTSRQCQCTQIKEGKGTDFKGKKHIFCSLITHSVPPPPAPGRLPSPLPRQVFLPYHILHRHLLDLALQPGDDIQVHEG